MQLEGDLVYQVLCAPGLTKRHVAIAHALSQGYFVADIATQLKIKEISLAVYLSEMRAAGVDVPSFPELKKLDPRNWPERWKLGKLCKRGHRWGDTQLSLRKLSSNGSMVCVTCCNRDYTVSAQKRKLRKAKEEIVNVV